LILSLRLYITLLLIISHLLAEGNSAFGVIIVPKIVGEFLYGRFLYS
jgi:hypothetical protein